MFRRRKKHTHTQQNVLLNWSTARWLRKCTDKRLYTELEPLSVWTMSFRTNLICWDTYVGYKYTCFIACLRFSFTISKDADLSLKSRLTVGRFKPNTFRVLLNVIKTDQSASSPSPDVVEKKHNATGLSNYIPVCSGHIICDVYACTDYDIFASFGGTRVKVYILHFYGDSSSWSVRSIVWITAVKTLYPELNPQDLFGSHT